MLRVLLVASGIAATVGSAETASALRGARVAAEEGQYHKHHRKHRHHQARHHGQRHHADQLTEPAAGHRFKQRGRSHLAAHRPRHMHHAHHKAGKKSSLNAFYAAHTATSATSLLEVGSTSGTGDPMLGANAGGAPPQTGAGDADLAALAQLTKAAGTIEMRFKKAESDKQFGEGLDKKLVGSVEKDSETFWDDVKGLTPADTQGLTDEDAQDLQKVVQQVAQMDDDLDDPKRTSKVAGEYDTIRSELQNVDV